MASIETTVSSPAGPILSLPGRRPAAAAKEETRRFLQQRILRDQQHLEEIDNWTTRSHRGSTDVKSYEELQR